MNHWRPRGVLPLATPRVLISAEEFAARLEAARPVLRVIAASEAGKAHADDVVQSAAVLALQRLGRFDPATDFRAWMAAMVRNAARNHRRGERRRAERARRAAGDGASSGPAPEADARLRAALDSLQDTARTCLLLKVVAGLSYQEIARVLNLSEATARSHAHRARLRLAELLAEGEGGSDAGQR